MKLKLCFLVTTFFSINALAGSMGFAQPEHMSWTINGGVGYTWYNHAYDGGPLADPTAQHAIGDGQTAFGRFAIGTGFYNFRSFKIGAELGLQSGNIMRLGISQAEMDLLAGLPIQMNVKPMLDLLATITTPTVGQTVIFGIGKAGIAYRRMQINERVTVNDLSQVAFELQAGLGMALTERASLALLYQGVFDGDTNFTINIPEATGHISNIPNQNGVMLSISYIL